MRITAKARAETRARILKEAANLLKTHGFSQTTTGDIARATGMAPGLRRMHAHRGYAEDVLRAGAGPSGRSHVAGEAERIRATHFGTVTQLIGASDGAPLEGAHSLLPSGLNLNLYWTLFLGVLNFQASDESPHQGETLALLDQSMKLLVESLAGRQDRSLKVNDGPISG